MWHTLRTFDSPEAAAALVIDRVLRELARHAT